VADEGTGIQREHLPHVFERFYRGDPSRTRVDPAVNDLSGGAGLGLSIAQWIVDEHGGTIAIESEPGTGTRVSVQFPAMANVPMSSS